MAVELKFFGSDRDMAESQFAIFDFNKPHDGFEATLVADGLNLYDAFYKFFELIGDTPIIESSAKETGLTSRKASYINTAVPIDVTAPSQQMLVITKAMSLLLLRHLKYQDQGIRVVHGFNKDGYRLLKQYYKNVLAKNPNDAAIKAKLSTLGTRRWEGPGSMIMAVVFLIVLAFILYSCVF